MRYRTALILSLVLACTAGPVAVAAAKSHHRASTGGVAFTTAGTPATVHPSGIATWFGPGFYGKKTACGQTLTPLVIGVANRTLPCGTLVKVVYAGHALVVPVLDRGPYSHIGAEWDLTAGAAAALGITETVRIATRVVGRTANSPTLGQPPGAAAATIAGGASAG
jgi:rare lipoprotein A (peptidoglycan hydrolase)